MPKLQFRTFDAGTVRDLPMARATVVTLDESTIALARWEPGWRWSIHMRPIVGSESCPWHHLGYALSGTLHVQMEDGESLDIPPESAYEIPPGHDAWVLGDDPFVTV